MSEDRQITFRHGPQTHEVIRYELVPQSDKYDSPKEFIETAVLEHSGAILAIASGGQQTRQLIRLLGNVRGIEEEEPDDNTSATIKGEQVSEKTVTIELPDDRLGILDDIQDHTGLDYQSPIIRRCVFRALNVVACKSNLLKNWQVKSISRTWTELQNGLVLPKHRFHEVLMRRFVIQSQATQEMIKQDPKPFDDFAEEYVEFYDSSGYDDLVETYGDRTFSDVENTIDEYSEHNVGLSEETSTFLEDIDHLGDL